MYVNLIIKKLSTVRGESLKFFPTFDFHCFFLPKFLNHSHYIPDVEYAENLIWKERTEKERDKGRNGESMQKMWRETVVSFTV